MTFGVFAVRRCQAIFCFLLFACSAIPLRTQAQGVQTSQAQTVHGTVINSLTREPIARALVYSPDNRFATLTDTQGLFEFPLPGQDIQSPVAGLSPTFHGNTGAFTACSGSTGSSSTFSDETGVVMNSNGPAVL